MHNKTSLLTTSTKRTWVSDIHVDVVQTFAWNILKKLSTLPETNIFSKIQISYLIIISSHLCGKHGGLFLSLRSLAPTVSEENQGTSKQNNPTHSRANNDWSLLLFFPVTFTVKTICNPHFGRLKTIKYPSCPNYFFLCLLYPYYFFTKMSWDKPFIIISFLG